MTDWENGGSSIPVGEPGSSPHGWTLGDLTFGVTGNPGASRRLHIQNNFESLLFWICNLGSGCPWGFLVTQGEFLSSGHTTAPDHPKVFSSHRPAITLFFGGWPMTENYF